MTNPDVVANKMKMIKRKIANGQKLTAEENSLYRWYRIPKGRGR